MTESTKIGEGRVDGEGSEEEIKGREAGMIGEECRRVTTGSSAWPLVSSSKLSVSSPLTFGFNLLFLCFDLRLIFLIERLILWWSDHCYRRRSWISIFISSKLVQTESWNLKNCPWRSCTSCFTSSSWSSNLRKVSDHLEGSLRLGVLEPKSMSI